MTGTVHKSQYNRLKSTKQTLKGFAVNNSKYHLSSSFDQLFKLSTHFASAAAFIYSRRGKGASLDANDKDEKRSPTRFDKGTDRVSFFFTLEYLLVLFFCIYTVMLKK